MGIALALVSAFVSAVLLVYAVQLGLQRLILRHPEALPALDSPEGDGSSISRTWRTAIRITMGEVARFGLGPLRERLELDLRRADEHPVSAEHFVARALVEGAAVAAVVSLLLSLMHGGLMTSLLAGVVLGLLHAFLVRPQRLHTQAAEQMQEIGRSLPYAVELATLVLGAGGTPRLALETLARRDDALGDEFRRVLDEISAGASQSYALRAMADRLEQDDLSSLVVAVNQGEATGAPMAKSLENQAEVFRFRRLQRAERLAVEAPVKMMFPTLLILIAVMVLILGPVFVQILQQDIF